MAIDMIPQSYRDGVRVRRAVARFALAAGALMVLGGATAGLLRWRVQHNLATLARLQQDAGSAQSVAIRVGALRARKASLEQSASALAALRANGSAGAVDALLQHALTPDVWVTRVSFARAEQLVTAPAGQALASGQYQQTSASNAPEVWQVRHRLELAGAALRYPALTGFLHGVSTRPGLNEVRLVDSGSTDNNSADVTFEISAELVPVPAAPARSPGTAAQAAAVPGAAP